MPGRRQIAKHEHTFVAISIERHIARCNAGVDLNLLGGSLYDVDPKALVYRFDTTLEVSGICTYPVDRAGERYDITVYSANPYSRELTLRISDLQARDKEDAPRFKKLKHGLVPVYQEAPSLGYIEKVRGARLYSVVVWVAPVFVTDALTLLSHDRQLYAAIQERRLNRRREVRSFSIQTADPSEE